MLETVLKLSNSRLMLFGAVAVDTVCMGTLAILLTSPSLRLDQLPPSLLLLSLAVTAPVLALAVFGCTLLVPKKFSAEERARRAIFAGTVIHLGVQTKALIAMLGGCACGPQNMRSYILEGLLLVIVLLVLLALFALLLRLKEQGTSRPSSERAPPSSEL